MNNNNAILEDTMDAINTIAKEKGFKNGIDWASYAQRYGEISYYEYTSFSNVHNLRVRYSHGNARDIFASNKTIAIVMEFLNKIRLTRLYKKRTIPYIPDDGFRAEPYYKEFNWKGEDGKSYYFFFKICYENNYIDDGYGGKYDTGYFIHILMAPYYEYALGDLHKFHIIQGSGENHICWNDVVTDFQKANAIMYVWVKRYVAVLEELMKNREISEDALMKRVNKKASLPAGTFRVFRRNKRKNAYMPHKRKTVYILEDVYNEIMGKLGTSKPELGGMLGWTEDQFVIDKFVFDENAVVSSVEYNPNIQFLNDILHNEWDKNGINLAGFVHSHPLDYNILSPADRAYAIKIMEAFDMPYLVMPIVTSSYEYKTELNIYVIDRNGEIEKGILKISKKREKEMEIDQNMLDEIEKQFEMINVQKQSTSTTEAVNNDSLSEDDIFARIRPVIDIEHMENCTIIGVGCGGARGFYEDMARVGVGRFYLIDADISSRSNIASQNGYISEIGKAKVDVVKNRLLDINDKAEVTALNFMLDDKITDEWLEENIFNNIDTKNAIICGFTDDFFAQARTVELSLKYGIPYLSAQHHKLGSTSEVVYWYPEISKYTPKQVLATRYKAYEAGYKNKITSVGSPIFNTTRLNAICSKLATGMLMYSANEMCEYSSFLRLKADNNLLIIRQKNLAFTDSTLKDLFEETDQLYFDDILWINPEDIMGE